MKQLDAAAQGRNKARETGRKRFFIAQFSDHSCSWEVVWDLTDSVCKTAYRAICYTWNQSRQTWEREEV
jgi:hypothetical protein